MQIEPMKNFLHIKAEATEQRHARFGDLFKWPRHPAVFIIHVIQVHCI